MNRKEISELYRNCERLGIEFDDILAFRRDSMTLRSWFERECNGYIERNETTGKWFYRGTTPIPDREKGARKRIAERCNRLNLHYYIQTDPRGWSLYLSREPLTDSNYTNGIGVGK